MELTVARIGRAHGLKGEVSVELRTDIPEQRLTPGTVFATEPVDAGPLTVTEARTQAGRWYVRFAELNDRTAAEQARGVELVIQAEPSDEEDAWYVHELIGLRAVRTDGTPVGEITDVLSMPAQDLLVVRQGDGHEAMVPMVDAFVPEVRVDDGVVVIDPPYGLLAGEQPESTGETG